MKTVTLSKYIDFIGFEATANLFGCKAATAKSWKYGMRQPSINQAKVIIKNAGGKLDFESIYGSDLIYNEDEVKF